MIRKFIFRLLMPVFSFGLMYGLAKAPSLMMKYGLVSAKTQSPSGGETAESAGQREAERSAPVNQGIVIDGKRYVKINGKYYEYREDNTYEIEGERVYYVDNRMPPPQPEASQARQVASGQNPASGLMQMMKGGGDTKGLELGDLETLKRAQEQLKERNKFLEDLMNRGQ